MTIVLNGKPGEELAPMDDRYLMIIVKACDNFFVSPLPNVMVR